MSDANFVLYTPTLADVARGAVESRYAVSPLRMLLAGKLASRKLPFKLSM
jgi:hypothetical protein